MNISFKNNIVINAIKYQMFREVPKLNKTLQENLERLNYKKMTVIQGSVIPLIIAGKDVMGFSSTGTGKTLSYLLPIFNRMINEGPPSLECNYLINPSI